MRMRADRAACMAPCSAKLQLRRGTVASMNALSRILCTAALVAFALLVHSVAKADEPVYTQAELDQMLAPVALYPDTVLTHVLIAATYPVQVVRAARWSAENSGLAGEAALEAVEDRDWDDSVKALVAFPELLARMNDDLEWTQRIGDAFLAQEAAVLDTVQSLRTRAYNAGNLKSSEKVRVVRETETIVIEPTVERIVYVPVYDTRVVYGPWWWSAHPPVHWSSWPGRHYSSVGFYWGHGVHVRPAFYYSSFHWTNRHIIRGGGHRWYHQPRYYHRPRGNVNHYAQDRPRVQANKPPIRRGVVQPQDGWRRPPITTQRRATSSRPIVQQRRPSASRPVTARPSRSVARPAARTAAPRAVAPRSSMPRSAPSRTAVPAPVRSSVRGPAAARAVPMSKPTTRAPAARAPASAPRSAPSAAPRQQTSRPARQKDR